jgi:hypothetical protein
VVDAVEHEDLFHALSPLVNVGVAEAIVMIAPRIGKLGNA